MQASAGSWYRYSTVSTGQEPARACVSMHVEVGGVFWAGTGTAAAVDLRLLVPATTTCKYRY